MCLDLVTDELLWERTYEGGCDRMSIRNACRTLERFQLTDCVLYSSCEPCPMCLAACYWSRIPTVYYGNTRADADAIGFSDEFIFQELGKDITHRQIAMKQMLRAEAFRAFRRWSTKQDRIPY